MRSGAGNPSFANVWRPPRRYNFTRDVFESLATDSPLRTGMTFVDRLGVIEQRSFAGIATDASRWAALLRANGLTEGDRMLVLLGRTPTWPAVVLGALKAGLVVVPCPEDLGAHELDIRVEHSGAALIVTDGERVAEVARMSTAIDVLLAEDMAPGHPDASSVETADTAADDPAFIYYTSEDGDEPRGVVHTHGYTWALRLQAEYWLDAHPDDVVWCTDEVGSARGMRNLLFGPWSRGAETVIHEGGFEAEQHCELMQRLGVTILCQTPDEYRALAALPEESRRGVRHLRHAVSEGRMLAPDVAEAFEEAFGVSIFAGYAPPESAILVANMPLEGMRQASIGRPLPGHEVIVIDAAGRERPLGVEGEIALWGRPASLFSGYWNAPDATDTVFRGEWYLTGDRGTRADGGYLWLSVTSDAAPAAAGDAPPPGALATLYMHPAVAAALAEVEQETAAARVPEEQAISPPATEIAAEAEQETAAPPRPEEQPTIPAATYVAAEVVRETAAEAPAPEEQPIAPATTGVAAELERQATTAALAPERQVVRPTPTEAPTAVEKEPAPVTSAPGNRPTTPTRPRLVVARQPVHPSTAVDARRELSRNAPARASDDEAAVDGGEQTLDDVLVARVRAYGQAEPR
jgi:acyl-coenzyme A synthetase/AMP-(fatty) acid ligase